MNGFVAKIVLLLLLLLPLQGCFTYTYVTSKYRREAYAGAALYGPREHLKQFDIVVLINEDFVDTSKVVLYPDIREVKDVTGQVVETTWIGSSKSACNFSDCSKKVSGDDVTFKAVLMNRENFKSVDLGEKTFRINAHYGSAFTVKACFAADRKHCPAFDTHGIRLFPWDKAKPIYSKELQDTLYVYTDVEYVDEPHDFYFQK